MNEEQAWVLQAQQGDDEAFTKLVETYQTPVFNLCYRMLGEPELAEDAAQETFLRAYKSWHTFQPGSDARRWLFTICRNAFLRSREKLRHEVDVEDGSAETIAAVQTHSEMRRDGSDAILSRVDLEGLALLRDRLPWVILADARLGVVYTISAAMAGAAGGVLAQTTGFASLDGLDFHRSADTMLMVVIGGAGWLWGGVFGAIAFKLLHDLLSAWTPQYWTFWLGLFLVVLVMVGRDRFFKPWTWFRGGHGT